MSVTSNAKAKICDNADKLLSMLDEIGVDVSEFVGVVPQYKSISDNGKQRKKRWRENHREKCREYWRKYIRSEKGMKYLEKAKKRSQDPEYKAKKNARRRELYKVNRDKILAREKELRELKKTPESMEIARQKWREYYANHPGYREKKRQQEKKYYELHKEEIIQKNRERRKRAKLNNLSS